MHSHGNWLLGSTEPKEGYARRSYTLHIFGWTHNLRVMYYGRRRRNYLVSSTALKGREGAHAYPAVEYLGSLLQQQIQRHQNRHEEQPARQACHGKAVSASDCNGRVEVDDQFRVITSKSGADQQPESPSCPHSFYLAAFDDSLLLASHLPATITICIVYARRNYLE